MPKPKPVAGADELLLLLTHHWARDESVLPTEDDRLDIATITLFQAYTGGRPAEFVDASKGDACKDPLGEAEELQEYGQATDRPNTGFDFDDADEVGSELFEDEKLYNSYEEDLFSSDDDEDWAEKDDPFDDEEIFDSNDEGGTEDEIVPDSMAAGNSYTDSGHSSITMTDCYPMEIEDSSNTFQKSDAAPVLGDIEEEIRKWKVLCYEDITLWIVQNPKPGGRDLLAMEVFLRHHKGADNKPKPYDLPPTLSNYIDTAANLSLFIGQSSCSARMISRSYVRSLILWLGLSGTMLYWRMVGITPRNFSQRTCGVWVGRPYRCAGNQNGLSVPYFDDLCMWRVGG